MKSFIVSLYIAGMILFAGLAVSCIISFKADMGYGSFYTTDRKWINSYNAEKSLKGDYNPSASYYMQYKKDYQIVPKNMFFFKVNQRVVDSTMMTTFSK